MITLIISGWTPLALASMGALWTELAGCLCVCIEGFIALGAFVSYIAYIFFAANTAAAVFSGAVFCALCALALVFIIWKLRLNIFVSGLAFNLIAEGFCAIASRRIFGSAGVLRLDAAVHAHGVFTSTAVCAVVLSAAALRWTLAGRRLRAAGLSAGTGLTLEAARESALSPERYFFVSWALAAVLASTAGSAMLFRLGAYVPYGTAGRGWLALAAVFMGFKKPVITAAAALAFAAASVLSSSVTGTFAISPPFSTALPLPLLPALPFIAALALYVLSCAAAGYLPSLFKSIRF